ncbi:MAG: endonuclease III domain-containing protein [Deltaproteobacteria bacterium]|nr:endonuclease III domain-containing protein [Deltaproteobacteria bacterium]
MANKKLIKGFYKSLFSSFGPQGWWPGRTRFEKIVGAILTQNTNWSNVEKAIRNLKNARALSPDGIYGLPNERLAELIRPSGYYNIKAKRLKTFVEHLYINHNGSLSRLFFKDTYLLRAELLGINGIGPETADSILLYAGARPVFVVDAYTKRVLARHGLAGPDANYHDIQRLFMESLAPRAVLFNEYHALIVRVGKEFCSPREPLCGQCPLNRFL